MSGTRGGTQTRAVFDFHNETFFIVQTPATWTGEWQHHRDSFTFLSLLEHNPLGAFQGLLGALELSRRVG